MIRKVIFWIAFLGICVVAYEAMAFRDPPDMGGMTPEIEVVPNIFLHYHDA